MVELSLRCLSRRANGIWCNSNPRLVRGFPGGPRPTSVRGGVMTHGTAHTHQGICSSEAALNLGFTQHSLSIGLLKTDKSGVSS